MGLWGGVAGCDTPVTPLVVPFCLFNMCCAYVVWLHQLLFTYVRSIDTVGELWPWIFSRVITCLIIGQVSQKQIHHMSHLSRIINHLQVLRNIRIILLNARNNIEIIRRVILNRIIINIKGVK
jgi:hypothetical protein